jgi:hypothetical protein
MLKSAPNANDIMTTTTSHEPPLTAPDGSTVMADGARALRGLLLHFAYVLVGTGLVVALFAGPRVAVSACLGVGLAALNWLAMRRIIGAVGGSSGAAAVWAMALPLKLIALVGGAFALVHYGAAQPVPLACGFALLPLTGVFLPRPSNVPSGQPLDRASRA